MKTAPRDNLVRAISHEPSLRAANGGPAHLFGHFSVFNVWSEIDSLVEGHFMERVSPGSFKKTFAENRARIKCLFNHGRDPQIGDKPLGPIEELHEDEVGAYYDVAMLNTKYNDELLPGLEAKLYGASYRFRVIKDRWVERPPLSEHNPHGLPERTVQEQGVYEFGPVTFPQYLETSAGVRSRSLTDELLVTSLLNEPERMSKVIAFGRTLRDDTMQAAIPDSADYRPADEGSDSRCGNCTHYDAGNCDKWDAAVESDHVCNSFSAAATESASAAETPNEEGASVSRERDSNIVDRAGAVKPRMYERATEYVNAVAWAMHPAALATVLGVLDARRKGEKLTPEQIRERIGAPPVTLDEDELHDEMDTVDSADAKPPTDPVAVINVRGPIVPHGNMFTEISGATSIEGLQRKFRQALDDASVKSILFNFDSPGGDVSLVPEFGAEILRSRSVKPIWGVANTWAASAAYWLFSACGECVVTDSGEIGSIGVYTAHTDISKAMAEAGYDTTLVYAGKYKVEGNPYEPLSAEAQAAMQEIVDTYYAQFTEAVAKGRGVPVATVLKGFGQGRMLTAAAAVEEGMADRVATFDATLAFLRKQAKTEADTPAASVSAETPDTPEVPDDELDDAAAVAVVLGGVQGATNTTVTDALHVGQTTGGGGTSSVLRVDLTQAGVRGAELTPTSAAGTLRETTALPEGADTGHSEDGSRDSTKPEKELNMLNRDEMVARVGEIERRLAEIDAEHGSQALPEAAWHEWDALKKERQDLKVHIADKDRRLSELNELGLGTGDQPSGIEGGEQRSESRDSNAGRRYTRPSDPFDLSTVRSSANDPGEMVRELGDRAKYVLEGAVFPEGTNKEQVQSRIDALLERDQEGDQAYRGDIARRILISGHPIYKRAFAKAIQGQPLTGEETNVLSRALSLTDSEGGYAVPFTLDPTVINTSNGVVNPLRNIARVITITNKEWKGVTSDGVTVAYGDEGDETSEDTPTFTQPEITPERCSGFVKFSFEIGGDFAGLQTEIASMFADARDVVEADKFLFGAGHASKEPQGLMTVLSATAGSRVLTEAINTLGLDDLDEVEGELPPRHRPLAQWIGNRKIYNKVKAAAGDRFDVWVRIRDGLANTPTGNTGALLNGYAANEASEMSDTVDGGEDILVLGDFRKFAVVDRVGMQIELIPHIMGANRLPTGQRGLLAWWRNSSGVLDANAFRVLRVSSS